MLAAAKCKSTTRAQMPAPTATLHHSRFCHAYLVHDMRTVGQRQLIHYWAKGPSLNSVCVEGLVELEQHQRIGLSSERPRTIKNLKVQVAVCRACLHHSVRAAAQRQRVGQRPDATVLQRLILELQQRRADLPEVQIWQKAAIAILTCNSSTQVDSTLHK